MKQFLTMIAAVMLAAVLIAVSGAGVLAQEAPLSGKVIETMDSGGYTYAQIEKSGKKTWVAVPKSKIAKGQNITFHSGQVMENFESKTLNRTFSKIYFSQGVAK